MRAPGEGDRADQPRPLSCQWGIFLRNHDELDLGRLTEKQREAVFAEFGPEKRMQLYDRASAAASPRCWPATRAGSGSPTR